MPLESATAANAPCLAGRARPEDRNCRRLARRSCDSLPSPMVEPSRQAGGAFAMDLVRCVAFEVSHIEFEQFDERRRDEWTMQGAKNRRARHQAPVPTGGP